jgi:hypothetical protein
MSLEFGFYPLPFDASVGDLRFSTLADLDGSVTGVQSDEHVEKNWGYAPARQTRDFFSGAVTRSPYSSRVFGLPKTHQVETQSPEDKGRLEFVVQCFGFLVGMRMSTTSAGFLDATPICPGVLTDFRAGGSDLRAAVASVDAFWLHNVVTPRVARALIAAVHSLFLSQQPLLLDFEKFIYLYISFDACHSTRCLLKNEDPTKGGHRDRIERLCNEFGISTPPWADKVSGNTFAHRNQTLHEGLFFDEPLGFQILSAKGSGAPNLLEMPKLLCRVIVGLLGIKTDYVRTCIDDRQIHKLAIV